MDKIKVLGIVGSLRKHSYNRSLLKVAVELAPEGMEIQLAEIIDLPMFNEDILDAGAPDAVEAFKQKIANADALLIA
ncbi:MAG: NADPH-dependent FMN reductase, partial [Chloroflexia bacterium]